MHEYSKETCDYRSEKTRNAYMYILWKHESYVLLFIHAAVTIYHKTVAQKLSDRKTSIGKVLLIIVFNFGQYAMKKASMSNILSLQGHIEIATK